jgi:hypothetical protein
MNVIASRMVALSSSSHTQRGVEANGAQPTHSRHCGTPKSRKEERESAVDLCGNQSEKLGALSDPLEQPQAPGGVR